MLGESDTIDHVPLHSALLYIVEGLVPLLSAFCKQLWSHSHAGLSKISSKLLTPSRREILTTVGYNLGVCYIMWHFCSPLIIVYFIFQKLVYCDQVIFLSTPTHFDKWITFLDSIISLLPYDYKEAQSLHKVWLSICLLSAISM